MEGRWIENGQRMDKGRKREWKDGGERMEKEFEKGWTEDREDLMG